MFLLVQRPLMTLAIPFLKFFTWIIVPCKSFIVFDSVPFWSNCVFLNNFRNQYFLHNPISKMNIHLGKQLYRLVLVTISCNSHDYLKQIAYHCMNFYFHWIWVRLFLHILCQYIFYFIFQGFANFSIGYFSFVSDLNYSHNFGLLNSVIDDNVVSRT